MSGRWIRPGLRYHQQGPGHNIRWGRTRLAALATVYNKEKEMAITGIEKDRPTPKKDTPIPRKKSGLLLLFAVTFAFFFTPFFHDFKGIKTKEKDKDKEKSESGSGHSWTGTDSGPGSGPLRSGF